MSAVAVFARDVRYLTTQLWARWTTILFAALPGLAMAAVLIPWVFLAPSAFTPMDWIVEGRKCCGLALLFPLAVGLVLGPLLGIRSMLAEVEESTLEVLKTTPLSGLEIFVEKVAAVLYLVLPLAAACLPALAFGWTQGWMSASEIALSFGLGLAAATVATAWAMALAGVTRSPEIAYPLVFIGLALWITGIPPIEAAPSSTLGWAFHSPAAALFRRLVQMGEFPVTAGEWAGSFFWCAAAGCAGAGFAAWVLFAGDVSRRRKWVERVPYAVGSALTIGLAARGFLSSVAGASATAVAGLAGLALVLGARFGGSVRPGTGKENPIARKEIAFYGTGGLRVLRDFVVLAVLAGGAYVAQEPSSWDAFLGPSCRLFTGTLVVLLGLGVILGATSLTLERSRNTFELLLLAPLPREQVYRGKLVGILRTLAPIAAAFCLVAACAGGPTLSRALGAVLATASAIPWVAGFVLYGMGVGAGTTTNGQAIGACAGILWLAEFVWKPGEPSASPWSVAWHLVISSLSPVHYGQHSLTLGEHFPAWNPLGFAFGLVAYALCAWGVFLALRLLALSAVRSIDPWGEAQKR